MSLGPFYISYLVINLVLGHPHLDRYIIHKPTVHLRT
jgi:hypothetical protein